MKKLCSFWLLVTLTAVRIYATPTPISVWSAENNANDSVGPNNGTLYGGYAAGKIGQAFSFNGTSQYAIVSDSSSLDRPNVTNAITVCAWVKWDGVTKPDYAGVVRKSVTGGVQSPPWHTYEMFIGNNGRVGFALTDGVSNGVYGSCNSTTAISAAVWHHIAGTFDGTTIKVYIDGALAGSNPAPANLHIGNREGPLYIGSTTNYANNDEFGGLIDQVELYDQALSLAEINVRGGFNLAPQANAGPDQIIYIGTGTETNVTLNGNGSIDPENDPLTYTWSGTSINASGVSPTVTLPLGIHMIVLSVTDGNHEPTSAVVHVAVVSGVDGAGYGQMQTLLQTLTNQAAADAATIDLLTQQNLSYRGLLQSLNAALGDIKTHAQSIIDISNSNQQAINTTLNSN